MPPSPTVKKLTRCECGKEFDIVFTYFDDEILTILVHDAKAEKVDVAVVEADEEEAKRFYENLVSKVIGKYCKCVVEIE